MTEQRFDEKDVLWRWTPTEGQKEASRYDLGDEIVFTPYDDASLVRRWWRAGSVWSKQLCGGPTIELLRQLRESRARMEELEQPLGELIAAWVEEFGEICVDDSADRLDRAMAAMAAALAHCERNVGT